MRNAITITTALLACLVVGVASAADAENKPADHLLFSSGLATASGPVRATALTGTADTLTTLSVYTAADFLRDQNLWPLTKDEASNILRALNDSVAAHLVAIEFYETALKTFGATASPAERKQIEANLLRCAQNAQRLHSLVKEWNDRVGKWK